MESSSQLGHQTGGKVPGRQRLGGLDCHSKWGQACEGRSLGRTSRQLGSRAQGQPACGDPPSLQPQAFPQTQGRGSYRPVTLWPSPHVCTEPATNLCVTRERISTKKVSRQDRTKAEM